MNEETVNLNLHSFCRTHGRREAASFARTKINAGAVWLNG